MLAYWIFVGVTIAVAFGWVKIRRQRKAPGAPTAQ
jgi:hypothetical protein